jgi:hypothetical protein
MSDQDDWEFAGAEEAKAEIRAAVGYLLRGATGGARGDITQAIISTVRQVGLHRPCRTVWRKGIESSVKGRLSWRPL